MKYKDIHVDKIRDIPKTGMYHAILPNTEERWYVDGTFHREDGPAVTYMSWKYYFLNNCSYTKSEYYKELYKRGLISESDYFIMCL